MLDGRSDLRDPVEAVTRAASLHVMAQDPNVIVIGTLQRGGNRLDVSPPPLEESRYQRCKARDHPDQSDRVFLDRRKKRRLADRFRKVGGAACVETLANFFG